MQQTLISSASRINLTSSPIGSGNLQQMLPSQYVQTINTSQQIGVPRVVETRIAE
jgi:hypothetical protein